MYKSAIHDSAMTLWTMPEKEKEPLVQPKLPSFIRFLECVSKRSEGSGLDDAWINSQLYEPTTTRQILEGKHMKRAHITTPHVLFNLAFFAENDFPKNCTKIISLKTARACNNIP